METRVYSKVQRWQLRQALEASFSSNKMMTRNGGTIAVSCPNPSCASHNRPNKLKLEFHLPTGLYSCWVCDLKGILRQNDRVLNFAKNNELRDWVDANSTHWRSWAGEIGVNWETLMKQSLLQIEEEVMNDEPEDLVDRRELPGTRLSQLSLEHSAWRLWLERWGEYKNEEAVLSEVWRYDVRVSLGASIRFAFPAWDEWGFLRGIHWWKPMEKIRYGNTGDKSDMTLAQHSIDWSSTIYLVEGVWDALKGGQNAVALLGSTLPRDSHLQSLLRRFKPPQTIIVLDPDAQEKAWSIARVLHNMGLNVSVACPPWKHDPGDMNDNIPAWIAENQTNVEPYGWQGQLSAKLANL